MWGKEKDRRPTRCQTFFFSEKNKTYFESACHRYAGEIKTHQEMHISVNKLTQEEEEEEQEEEKNIVKAISCLAAALIRILCKNASSA